MCSQDTGRPHVLPQCGLGEKSAIWVLGAPAGPLPRADQTALPSLPGPAFSMWAEALNRGGTASPCPRRAAATQSRACSGVA